MAMKAYDISGLKILIVDRNRNMRRILKQLLRAFNVRDVKEAEDGADAFKVMRTFVPDIILTEMSMAPMDGLEFVRMLRTATDSPVVPWTPIIMITSHTEGGDVAAARDAGVHEFLAKPISAITLYKRIVAVLGEPRAFIKCKSYVGPDRHRRPDDTYEGPRRRSADQESLEEGFDVE